MQRATWLLWNLGLFTLAMAVPELLYLATSSLVSEAPATVHSWREHFNQVRPWFFAFYGSFIVASAVREILLLSRPVLGISSGADAISLLNATTGAIWSNRRVQIAVITIEVSIALLVSAQRFYAGR